MNRTDLINAIASADVKKIVEIQRQEEESWRGKVILAELNANDLWDIPVLGWQTVGKELIKTDKYMNLTYEAFAALIVRYDFQAMCNGWYVNTKFPEHSWAYVAPDPTETPELKYQRILNELFEVVLEWKEFMKTGKHPEKNR